MSPSYEEQRAENIKANEELLKSLGLATLQPIPRPAAKSKPKPKATSKAKAKLADADYEAQKDGQSSEDERPRRRVPAIGPRRSLRAIRKAGQSESEGETSQGGAYEYKRKRQSSYEPQRNAQKLGIRTQDPKRFGHIPGVPVGKWWASRMDCSTDAVHAPTVAGISGNAEEGAWSVALSGGYPDDVDMGEAFTYTGSGGRDLKGTKNAPKNLRTAPQTSDQTFQHRYNAALKKSAETGKPVRVIRGFKLDNAFAPVEGYRYDGLYTVEKAWLARGLTKGLKVCRYAFKRMPGQPPLPICSEAEEEDGEDEGVVEDGADEGKAVEERGGGEDNMNIEAKGSTPNESVLNGDDVQANERTQENKGVDIEAAKPLAPRAAGANALHEKHSAARRSVRGRPGRVEVVVEIPLRRPLKRARR